MEGINTFKTCYCDFLDQLKIYDNQDGIIQKYIDEYTTDDKIEETLNKMVDNLLNYSKQIKENDYSIFDEDSENIYLSEINIKTIWKDLSDNDKKQVFSHINYCNIIGKFVLDKATLDDIKSLYSKQQEEQEQEEQKQNPEQDDEVMTEEEQKKMVDDLNGITNDLEDLEKNIRDTIGDESLNQMQEQLSGIFGNLFNPTENNENNQNNENGDNPLTGIFENIQSGGNPFESMFDSTKLQQMSEDIKSKVQSGEINEEKLKQTSEDMMKMVGKLSQSIGPLLGNIMSGMTQGDNEDVPGMGGDIGSLLGGLMGNMATTGGSSEQKTDPLSRAMSAGMQAMADKNGGNGNPLSGLMSALGGGVKLNNDEKSELRTEERMAANRKEARRKYRQARRKRQKQLKKQKKKNSKKTPTTKK
jgi:hypothetical protein